MHPVCDDCFLWFSRILKLRSVCTLLVILCTSCCCSVLRAALPDKGFTAHVIGYTAHAVLAALVAAPGFTVGAIDNGVELMLPLLEADLFGQVRAWAVGDVTYLSLWSDSTRSALNSSPICCPGLWVAQVHSSKQLRGVAHRQLCYGTLAADLFEYVDAGGEYNYHVRLPHFMVIMQCERNCGFVMHHCRAC